MCAKLHVNVGFELDLKYIKERKKILHSMLQELLV